MINTKLKQRIESNKLFHPATPLTVPGDMDRIVKLNSLQAILSDVSYIACKKHATLERPYFFSKGITKTVIKDLSFKMKHVYTEDFMDQAIELDLSLSQIKKFYAIINTTEEDFLPEIDPALLLPFYIKKILCGKANRNELITIGSNNNTIDYNEIETINGHSWLNKNNLVANLELVGYDKKVILHWIAEFSVEKNGYIIYKEYYLNDKKLASMLNDMKESFFNLTKLDTLEIEDYYSPDQKVAIKELARNNVSFLRGGAGTGKTSTVDAVIENMGYDRGDVLALAPTHKAKVRMRSTQMVDYGREVTGSNNFKFNWNGPQTIHTVGYACMRTEFNKGFSTLIVDEIGMVGSEHSKLLINIINKLGIEKVIFIGDPEQLAPVGLGSLIDVLEHCNIATFELTTCHRSVKSIYNLCANILSKQHISKDIMDIHEIEVPFIHKHDVGFHQQFTPEYKDILLKYWDVSNKEDFVSIAYTNRAVNRLNVLSQIFLINDGKLTIPDNYEKHKEDARASYKDGNKNPDLIIKGDVVISSINDGDLVNGSRAEVLDITSNQYGQKFADLKLFEKDVNDNYITVSGVKLEFLSLAYACTIHKMQGDEAKNVAYIWSNRDTCSLAYTACSRPRKNLFVFVPSSDSAYIPLNSNIKRKTTFYQ